MTAAEAVGRLRDGGVVALPTETVYGLAADATNAAAVSRIFAIKGRPTTNPLIVHVADVRRAKRFAADWPEAAERLAAAFWPGPLTIVVRKSPLAVPAVAAGGTTVGLRVPDHPLTLAALDAFDGGVAAPSANRSNRISPTTAAHIRDEFGDTVPVLDGGPCRIGIESTVVDVSDDGWRVLRPGAISERQIADVLIPLPLRENLGEGCRGSDVSTTCGPPPLTPPSRGGGPEVVRAPGQLAVHYAPQTPAFRFEAGERQGIDLTNAVVLEPTLDPETYARNLYGRLRLLDTQGLDAIYVEMPPDTPPWRAVRDRLLRATRPLSSKP